MDNAVEKPRDLRLLLLGMYLVVIFCSLFQPIQTGLHLLLFLTLLILYADRIKFRTIIGIIIITGVNVLSYFIGENFSFGFWDPINFLMKYIAIFQVFVLYDIFISLTKSQKIKILNLIFISITITNLLSIYYNILDPLAIRYRSEQYLFVINFNQFYALPILVPAILTKILFQKKINALLTITFLSSIIVLLIGSLVTGLVLGILSCFLVFILWVTKSSRFKQIITLFLIAGLTLLIRLPLAGIIRKVANADIFSSLTSTKLLIAAGLLEGEEATSTLDVRNDYKQAALNSFKEEPLFGIPYSEYRFGTISSHADWYDFLAMNGIVGIIALLIVFADFCRKIFINIKSEADFISFSVSLIIFIALGFLNPNFAISILITTFLISPNITLD